MLRVPAERNATFEVRENAYVSEGPVAVVWWHGRMRGSAVTNHRVITDTDIGAMLHVFDRCQPSAADDIFYADVRTGLRELIPCNEIGFQLMDVAEQHVKMLSVNDSGVERDECVGMVGEWGTLFWQQFWGEHGCAGPLKTGDYTTVLHHAETSRSRAYANTPCGTLMDELGINDEVLVPMTPLAGMDRRLLLRRTKDEPDFSEREKAMLALVRPHLAELQPARPGAAWRAAPDAASVGGAASRGHGGQQRADRSHTRALRCDGA